MGFILDYGSNHPEASESMLSLISALEYSGVRCSLYIPNKREIKSDDVEVLLDNREPVVAYGTSPREFFREQGIDFVVSLDTDSCMSVVSDLKRRMGIPGIIHSMTLGNWDSFFTPGQDSFHHPSFVQSSCNWTDMTSWHTSLLFDASIILSANTTIDALNWMFFGISSKGLFMPVVQAHFYEGAIQKHGNSITLFSGNNPPCRTAVIVSVVEETVLLQDTEDLLPVDLITGALKVLRDLLIAITDKFPAQQLPDLFQDLRVQDRNALIPLCENRCL